MLLFPRRSFVNRISVALVVVSVLALTACGSSPSPLSPSVVPASILIPATDAPLAPHSLSVRSSSSIGVIVINRGDFDLSSSGGRIAVSGTRGFSLTAAVTRSGGILEAFDSCFASNCDPGRTIPLEAAWSGTDLPATMTLDGKTYMQVGSLATATAAAVRFSGTVLAPPMTDRGSQTVTAPFSVRGQFVHEDDNGQLVTETFTGEGVARVALINRESGTGWSVERVLYRFRH
jgi:hypothetical protein